jgi:pyruvate formate lyase activating enzyme
MPLEVLQDKKRLRTLKEMLHRHSGPADEALIERHANGDVQCFACGHRCLVKPGRDGVCRVRFNENGSLLVPRGYVGALACDPIEKKPFFHVLPGSDALTFGMLGCDYHCGYCFPGETIIATAHGPMTLADAFAAGADRMTRRPDADIALPTNLKVVAGSGNLRPVRAVFRHSYRGPLSVIRPYYFPAIRCTPDHRVYATSDPSIPPAPIQARHLTARHLLAVPRKFGQGIGQTTRIDLLELLCDHQITRRVRWKLSESSRRLVASASAAGQTSRQIGQAIGISASYVRHVRSKLARGGGTDARQCAGAGEQGRLRFPGEHRPGIPATLDLTTDLATLLGYYCAEGCAVRSKARPNSWVLNFSFSHDEAEKVDEVVALLNRCLGVRGRRVHRTTTSAVAVGKASASLAFKALAGGRAKHKRVPAAIFDAPVEVAHAFLASYVSGDGCRYPNGKVSVTTVSRDLAYGVAWLALRLGWMPSLYRHFVGKRRTIQGRIVRPSEHQYTVVWYEKKPPFKRKFIETDDFYLLPLRRLDPVEFDGDVFNMEVEEEHNYLAGFLLVSNCQNWVTSQMLRDANAVAAPKECTPAQLVDLAIQHGAPVIASSYNEPLITSEWAVEVFKEARPRGLRCAYISNGNGTPQVLDFLRPHVDAYKVDLKTFNDKNYRQLGGVMEHVTNTIRMLKDRGFWVEIVTLVVPGFSDDADDLKRMAEFLAGVDPLMPWHMTAFHPDYKMTEGFRRTRADDLMKIVEYGKQAGIRYLYPGNLPGQVGEWENTRCHHCNSTVIERRGFLVQVNRVETDGLCPSCRKPIPGIWGESSGHGDGRVRPLF